MPPSVATVLFAGVVLGLFALDRDRHARTSKALWLPVVWVSLAGSRMASQWFGLANTVRSVDQALDGNPLDRNILAGLLVAGLIVLFRRPQVGSLLRANWPILAFFSYCAVSTLWSDFPDVAFKRWTKAVGDLVMVLIILTDPDRSGALKRVLAQIAILLVPASILLIKYYPQLGQVYSGQEGKVRYTGVTMDKNMLGVVCLVSGLGCAWRLVDAYRHRAGIRKGPLIAQGLLLAMVLWLFQSAQSMTSLACFGLAAGIMVATSFPALVRKRVVVNLLVVSVLCFAFAVLFLGAGAGLVETMGKDSTLSGRTGLWNILLSINENSLLGAGFESFWLGTRLEKLWSLYWWHPNEAHNGYLEVFLNLGWIGVGLLALMIATGYRNVVRALGSDPDTGSLRMAFFVAGTAYGLTEAAFRLLCPVWIVFVLALTAVPKVVSARPSAVRPGRDPDVTPGTSRPSTRPQANNTLSSGSSSRNSRAGIAIAPRPMSEEGQRPRFVSAGAVCRRES